MNGRKCLECENTVEEENISVGIYLCKKCDAKNWVSANSKEGRELIKNDHKLSKAINVQSPYYERN